jgi:hypothetical protein
VSAPIRLSLEVACPAGQAFELWTRRIGTWWPPDHTVSGERDFVVLDGAPGGRIYERTADGVEHEWGRVTLWEPPARLGYSWYIGRTAADATFVQVSFVPVGEQRTVIEIEHRGWERLGDDAATWRNRNQIGWKTLLPHFVAAATVA